MPSVAFACGTDTEKHSCKKEVSSTEIEKNNCCGADDNSSENEKKDCGGECDHAKCGCSSTTPISPLNLFSEIIFQYNNFNYSVIEKVKFPHSVPSISDGFYSIWLIPKIS